MAIADLTDLWQAAASAMGETGTQRIVDATTPTYPLELTFDSFYDRIRLEMLRRTAPLFARRYDVMRRAPTHDAFGTALVWSRTWGYVYRVPSTSIKFMGFRRDRGDLGLVQDFVKTKLPIYYTSIASASESPDGVYAFNAHAYHLYKGYVYLDFEDTLDRKHTVTDDLSGDLTSHVMQFKMADGSDLGANTTSYYYTNEGGGVLDLNGENQTWSSDAPSQVSLQVAAQPASESQWSENVLCNLYDSAGVYGVYLVDVTDPSLWSEEFQDLVAAEMARRAAMIHAKSTKKLRELEFEVDRLLTQTVVHDTTEENTESHVMSSAERARL